MQGSPSPQFSALFERATENERRHATAVAATVRLGGAALFLLLALAMWKLAGRAEWEFYLPPLAVYFLAALVTFRFRQRAALARFDWLPPVVDVAFLYAIQSRALAVTDQPRAVAGFSLGLFTLLVVLSGLTLRPRLVYGIAAMAAAAEISIMLDAGVTNGFAFAGALVLFLAAVASHHAIRRVQLLGMDLAQAEISRQLEHSRLAETDAARKSAELSLMETQAHNERLARLQRDKDSLVQLIVHDLRSPVNAMTLSLEFIAQDLKSLRTTGEIMEALDDARSTANRLVGMIAQILDTAKLEEGRMRLESTPLVAADLLDKARHEASPVARSKRVAIETEVSPGLSFRADPRLFPRLVENLVSNSLRHTPTGGRILLRATKVEGQYCLSVHNNGAPVDAADRNRIFEKFQQGDGAAQRLSGWGLGLYFCRMVVEAHGGRISVEDVDGWPTSFVIRLPAEEVTVAKKVETGETGGTSETGGNGGKSGVRRTHTAA